MACSAVSGLIPPDFWLGFIGLGLALGLIAAGLLSSTGHLGRPERAWRAFSQWRSSWLSREGVAVGLTFIPAGLFGIGWVFFGRTGGWVAIAGLLAAVGAVVTVCTTGMIYASLKPIAQWHSRYHLAGLSDLRGDDRQRSAERAAARLRRRLEARCWRCALLATLARLGLEARDLAAQ